MNIRIEKGYANGTVAAPPSKSYAHRLLICAALAQGVSTIRGIALSEDILATIDCIEALGGKVTLEGTTCKVEGVAGRKSEPDDLPVYNCRESGSTLRFFIPIALALTGGGVFKGTGRLMERGIGVYAEIFKSRGIEIDQGPESVTIRGWLEPGIYRVRGDVSSQFISGLLFALPMLFGSSAVEIIPPVESRPYINITADVFRLFGVEVKESADDRFMIQGNQQFMPANTRVEGDWSNAAFLEAIARLAAPHGLEITGLKEDSLQGDKCCVELFEKLSAGGNSMIDISECPDLGPVLFAYAAASGGGHFTGIRRLRIKESDRAEAMAEVLLKFGIRSIIYENEMDILPGELKTPAGPVSGHNDHRIVMAAAVLMLLTGGCIEEAQAVRKSYPDFFETLNSIGIKTYTEEEA